ncbi:MAG: hypothetical protein DLM60_21470 [Pseudonocardiales bacterium]|nr:MAG: hypothetical protein DLM60_21470 [Pseudonocardiales bacterium]
MSADRAHPVSTITIRSRIEPPLGGAPKNSRDLAPVPVPMAAPTGLLSMAARLATEHLAGEFRSLTASPLRAVNESS